MKSFFRLAIFSVLTLLQGCSIREKSDFTSQEVATSWAEMTLYITKNTPANSPTYASRCLGYIGLTMYESVVHGYPEYKSLAGQLNGLSSLPLPEGSANYNWLVSLNAGQASILRSLYNQTSDANKQKIDSLERLILNELYGTVDSEIVKVSERFGRDVANAIFEWSKIDGGHRGYLKNFDKKLKLSAGPGLWEPPLFGQAISHYPLHPYWGKNRNFVLANAEMAVPEMIRFDTAKNSAYYLQFMEVYNKNRTLTQQEKEAALWWGDDPSETFSPPGHSYYLASCVLKAKNPDLIVCAETYAKMGMAVADAFVNCWRWKYHYVSERPSSYLGRFVEPGWEPFWPDPPFPAFPSGHATNAAVAATVLSDLFGEELALTDSAHAGRRRDGLRDVDYVPRTFGSFWEMAEETANSRFYGGIHTAQDNEVGLAKGREIAGNINALKWKANE